MTDEPFLHELEAEVEAEVRLVESSKPADTTVPPEQWLFDPADVEREEVGLRNLLGAVESLESTEAGKDE